MSRWRCRPRVRGAVVHRSTDCEAHSASLRGRARGTTLANAERRKADRRSASFVRQRKESSMRASIANGMKKGGMVAALLATATVTAFGSAGCGESAPPPTTGNDDVTRVQSAITQITISGRVTKTGNIGVANIPIRLNGQSQAWALTNSTGNYSFTVNPGSYSVRPEEAACTFVPDVVNLNNLTANTTRNFTVSGAMCTGTPVSAAKAMVLVDSRLYAQLGTEINQYKAFAEARRGFTIDLRKDQQFDAMTFTAVKQYIVNARAANPAIEGVLFIGNIKLPSFYKSRLDISLTRLYPRYYDDLDGISSKRYATGEIDPICPPSIPNGDVKCVVSPRADGSSGPVTVIAHDFDDLDYGPNPGPEIWTAYMPVGVAGSANTYTDFANQLRPYFQKLARYYNHELLSNGRYYYVSNDHGEQFDKMWNTWGKTKIDWYGRPGPNGETGGNCFVNGTNVCYARWNLESFASPTAFMTYWESLPFVDEGWQQDTIYLGHMNAQLYDVAEVLLHSGADFSLITSTQAKTITNGGLIAVSGGCGVAGYSQPGAPATTAVDGGAAVVSNNIMLAYLYGSAKSVASLGAPAWRGHSGRFQTAYEVLKLGGNTAYLGAANKVRLTELYTQSMNKWDLKENSVEQLFGDPFMDLRP
jgi:hypothetical protein